MKLSKRIIIFSSVLFLLLDSCTELNQSKAQTQNITEQVDDYDNHTYDVIRIGNQTWTKENLNVTHFRNGDTIFQAQTGDEFQKLCREKKPAWIYCESDPQNVISQDVEIFGKLYNWYAVNNKRDLSPDGFHIPSINEWQELNKLLGEDAGMKMKDSILWTDKIGTNESGFSGLPGGSSGYVTFYIGHSGIWWSSTRKENSKDYIYGIQLAPWTDKLRMTELHNEFGYSVRCLKN